MAKFLLMIATMNVFSVFGASRRLALLLAFVGLMGLQSPSHSEIVPASRRTTWEGRVGVPGGIPNRTTIYTTLPAGASAAQIEAAINACPAGQVVQLSAGTYNLTTQVRIYNKSDWTLRGAGMGKTIITGGSSAAFSLGQAPWTTDWAAPTPITSGYQEGSTSITLASTAGVTVGKPLYLEQDNSADVFGYGAGGTGSPTMNSSGRLRDGNRVLSQIVMVTGINGSTVTFTPSLNFSFNAALNPQAVSFGNLSGPKNSGLEDLTVSGSSGGMGVWWMGAYGCWLKNVELTKWGTFGFEIQYCLNMEMRGCYIHEPYSYNWGRGYAVQFDQANNCLVEDNMFWKFQDGIVIQGGCSGNVIAYNCLFQSYPAYNGVEIMLTSLAGNHTPYPLRNLFEGNFANGFHPDFYYGPSREGVLLRNYFPGTDPTTTQNRIVINLDAHQRYYSVVGNILGSDGTSGPITATGAGVTIGYVNTTPLTWTYNPGSGGFSSTLNVIYRLGYPFIGNNGFGSGIAVYDPVVPATTLIHGNYDYASKSIKWDPTISDQTIPNSFFRSSKPGFFGGLSWPPYDPSKGASMTVMNMTNLPAGYRFIFGRNPPSGTGNEPPFAKITATPTTGGLPLTVNFSSAGSTDYEGTALTYNWSFGDGTSSTAANPSKTYSSVSNFVALLTVSDGTNSSSASVIISVVAPGSGLVAAYGFDEGKDLTVSDASGNANHGTISGAAWASGKTGAGLSFTQTNAVISVPHSASLNLTSGLTLEAWVYPTALGTDANIIYKDTFGYALAGSSVEQATPSFGGSFTPIPLFSPTPLALNTWSHLATTYDGNVMRIYINGTEVASRAQNGAMASTTGALMIGGNSVVPGKNWTGKIDEVRIYNRALAPAEVVTDMNTRVAPPSTALPPPPPTNIRIVPN
jgi:PKD repeat protein